MTATGCETTGDTVVLPFNPFVSNRYHYGMLLGVADLETEQGYHRGKTWFHSAWLHGGGAVWGLKVEQGDEPNQLLVRSGLAIDHHGRELWLRHDQCIDIAQWYAGQESDDIKHITESDGCVEFVAHVQLCADHCTDRPVPSISEPCDGSDFDTAYSRTVERAKVKLVAGEAESLPDLYPGLRAWAEHPTSTYEGKVGSNDGDHRPVETCSDRLRRLAVEDTMALRPADPMEPWSPHGGDGCIALAQLRIRLDRDDGDGWRLGDQLTIDNSIRPVHIQTRAAQKLLRNALCCCAEEDRGGSRDSEASKPVARREPTVSTEDMASSQIESPPDDAGLFRAVADSAELNDDQLSVTFTVPVASASVSSSCFTVSALQSNRWRQIKVKSVGVDDTGTIATLNLETRVHSRPVRAIVRGRGEHPVIAEDFRPLLGCTGDQILAGAGFDAELMIAGNTEPDSFPSE